ncbi:pyridoxamine 5'-phosphate oxidase [Kwoniella sp. DSM 27419]
MSSSTPHLFDTPAPQPGVADQPDPNVDDQSQGKSHIHVTSHNQYNAPRLLRDGLSPNPLIQFNAWLESALQPKDGSPVVREPEAMAVCTSTPEGIPSARVVLLKTVDEKGFVFFTNYNSRKSQELAANPYASLAFYWREIHRQVRVVGKVEKVTREESEEYFASRPRGSQLGAWASQQSSVVQDGDVQNQVEERTKDFDGKDVECPPHWGGWRIVPFEVEFWAGQPSRLHDRFRYTRAKDCTSSEWAIDRLAP